MPEPSGFLTSEARFFVKIYFHKKCGVFEACKKAIGFFDTLKESADLNLRSLFSMCKKSDSSDIFTASAQSLFAFE